ncbi:unnamed protein product [Cuscuta campestris]|uniref:Ribosomal RNA-processing protein 7 C-terminal domain-containing protein n=2 Tax=Cuscuta sect. Cleistogrammica TaxID=1824901 RepID=A0A484LKG2_9ASTE|nr:hypothetical protein DM860_013413 [Cuscuta australis]VFQ76962.1 unnamed protein product [Cuscuta campestris]
MVPMEKKIKKANKVKVKLKRSKDEAYISHSIDEVDTHVRGKKKKKLSRNRKRENDESTERETDAIDQPNEIEGGHGLEEKNATNAEENEKNNSRRKRRKSEKQTEADSIANEVERIQKRKSIKKRETEKKSDADCDPNEIEETQTRKTKKSRTIEKKTDANKVEENQNGESRRKKRKGEKKNQKNGVDKSYIDAENRPDEQNGKSRKLKDHLPNAEENVLGKSGEAEEVYELSSGDEHSSKGMQKWITEYYQSRPGLQVLQDRIDEYIVAYEAEKEKERKKKEAMVAEDGWTVVAHHKGRKKTTDSESGIAVGSVSQAAALENLAKKKQKETGLNFYQFQKRDAKRNEIMELQSKFEQDKKRAQQLRAARKFRPL